MGQGGQALRPGYGFSMTANMRDVFIRTLTARIHSVCSAVLNVLHSLRTFGLLQGEGSHKPTADQTTTRAAERIVGRSIGVRVYKGARGVRVNTEQTRSRNMPLHPADSGYKWVPK